MRIAIVGWGSLIWQPKDLATDDRWQPDGPWLPIEFARVSKGERLTLVLLEGVEPVRSYWILSAKSDLDEARQNLRQRECCAKVESVGFIARDGRKHFAHFPGLQKAIGEWLEAKPQVDTVIWTDLRSNFKESTGNEFSVLNAVKWLEERISQERHGAAEEYFRKAPRQTDTALRRCVREKFGWRELSTF